eukprot:TRINITY_DN192_c0_g1_i2.p1 TRINITY_DN192_c0_g1~~TRINITY_DN192_c0_g1_i2.p1  ORF type:complete len:523 (+),score=270.99 TRINITY_DN192_c0_g1_i2:70-1638(+)
MGCCQSLEINEQLRVTTCNGERYIENGPGFKFINLCSSTETRSALVLQAGERALVMDEEDGKKRPVYGPTVEFMSETETCEGVTRLPELTMKEYINVRDLTTGHMKTVVGPTLYQIGPYEEVSEKRPVFNLSQNEYLRIKDQEGKLRIERGEQRVVPLPSEEVIDGVQSAVNIDDHHAVLVRNTDSGDLKLFTEHGLFFPTPYQQIVGVKEKIILEEYQTVVYKDPTGAFHYVRGDSEMRDFFLQPFCELVTQDWSTDLRKEHSLTEQVWKFDRRPSYMNYEFNCRTVDNVELCVDVSFFWAIIDVQLLIQKTADAPGDTCTHARSKIIQEVSRLKLLTFLEKFNEVIRNACVGDAFYEERGVNLISVEVLKFKCASKETDGILQEIIQETADRLKKKERQKGENEVALARLGGEIEEERMKKELIELRKSHLKTEARIEGEAEANKLTAFLDRATSDEGGPPMALDAAMNVYMTLRKLDSIHSLSNGASQIYLTPNDVNLSVGQMFPAPGGAAAAAPARPF